MAIEITPEIVDTLAAAANLTVPADDRELLAAILRNQLAAVRLLEDLDVQNVEPIVSFDPRGR